MIQNKSLLKQPSAWIPIVMSLAALTMTFAYLAIFGIPQVPQADEGTPAHLFQLLMAGQVPIIAFFAIKHLPPKSKQALFVLALQLAVGLAACAPVFILGL